MLILLIFVYRLDDIFENGDGTVSKISYIDKRSNIKCDIVPKSVVSGYISELLSKYMKIDERATKLMRLFRHWGKVYTFIMLACDFLISSYFNAF